MILPNQNDAIHKAWLYRTLSAIVDDNYLSTHLRFKGGTCAAMRGFIERFSVDLDFDLTQPKENENVHMALKKIFQKMKLKIDQESKHVPQFFLKYNAGENIRNTLKLDVTFPAPKANIYEPVRFEEIDRIIFCQTIETMFTNKMVAVIDRYEKNRSIAGRDIFDIHSFLLKGIKIIPEIIAERTQLDTNDFLVKLQNFIETKISQQSLDEDLNYLLPKEKFNRLRKNLKQEVLALISDMLY